MTNITNGQTEHHATDHLREGYDRNVPATPAIVPFMEQAENGRVGLARALAEIRAVDEASTTKDAIITAQIQRIKELEALVDFLDKRHGVVDSDRILYARQSIKLATKMKAIWLLAEEAVQIANAADALGIGGEEKAKD